jgi:hypothetical protein
MNLLKRIKNKTKMRTKIISAFPGTGKSYYHKLHPDTTLDSDSSNFSWVKDENGNNTKERNPNFPQNYIEHIKANIGKYEYIFVSSHKEVRDALLDNCLFFYVVYPDKEHKEEYIQRYKDRGNNESFIQLVDSKWDEWINDIHRDTTIGFCKRKMFKLYIDSELRYI